MIALSEEQEEAVEKCCNMAIPVYAVTGRAGTGKTTILQQVHKEMKRKAVVLCAPTGRAAKRIQEATGIGAVTVHKLLEFPKPGEEEDSDSDVIIIGAEGEFEMKPKRNKDNPLLQNVVLVDEASMVGATLYKQLLDALPRGGVIRFFGDRAQLPPVEDGVSPFRALCQTESVSELTHNYRSEDEIIGNSELILRGRIPKRNDRFEVIYTDDPVREMVKICGEEYATSDHQVIMTMRKGMYGTTGANPRLQRRYNSVGESLTLARFGKKEPPLTVRANDKFIWIRNDYNFNLFNGELGEIEDVDQESGDVILGLVNRGHVHIPARAKGYSFYGAHYYDPRKQIDLGYAITTHKAQGSEFDTVVYVMSSKGQGGMWMCSRNNFYTGVTRARKKVIVICDRRAMQVSLRKSM